MSFSHTASVSQQGIFIISNRNSASSQYGGVIANPTTGAWGQSAAAGTTSAVDTTAETTIVITGQKALGSETLTLERYTSELTYGA